MKYLSLDIVVRALNQLEKLHPFYGITFLVFKENKLPVGSTTELSIDSLERKFMDKYYKPVSGSDCYYRVFRLNNASKKWLAPRYPGSGSQSTRTRGEIAKALIHNTKKPLLWGWQPNYVDVLARRLADTQKPKVPLLYLAIWLYRERKWDDNATTEDIKARFIKQFNITSDEIEHLFDLSPITERDIFDDTPIQEQDLIPIIGIPPDLPEEGGGTLSYLELRGVGPADILKFEPARRLNLITGDNGLGKTFLLDTAWWALTREWVDYPADPTNRDSRGASITYRIEGEISESSTIRVKYDNKTFSWPVPRESQAIPSLLVYARADNSFAVLDPAQHYYPRSVFASESQAFMFSAEDVWFGLEEKDSRRSISEGLLRDWVRWQQTEAPEFKVLVEVLKQLSPKDMGTLRPGKPTRVPGESRPIPTLSLPYGDVAIIYASAGMRRIVSLAYLLVWSWSEHKTASLQAQIRPQRRMVILIDELEAHLHPKWQRMILPALLKVQAALSKELSVQFFIATHSPLVMASTEPVFNEETDKIFKLDLVDQGLFESRVILKELPFVKYGVADSWLTSDFFELGQPRSELGESAIEQAKQLQLQQKPDTEQVREVHQRLVKYLPADDEFWPRWLFFAESHGVET